MNNLLTTSTKVAYLSHHQNRMPKKTRAKSPPTLNDKMDARWMPESKASYISTERTVIAKQINLSRAFWKLSPRILSLFCENQQKPQTAFCMFRHEPAEQQTKTRQRLPQNRAHYRPAHQISRLWHRWTNRVNRTFFAN